MSSVTESFRRVFPKSFSQWSRVSSRRRRPNAAAVTVFSYASRLILGSFFASSPASSRGATRLRSCVSTVGPRRLENRPPARAPHGRPYREMGALPSRSRSGSSRRSLTFVIRRTHLRGAAAVVNCIVSRLTWSSFASSPALSRGATRLRSCISTVGSEC